MTESDTRAYDEGFNARRSGEPETANPYPPDTKKAPDWIAGWEDLDEHLAAREAVFLGW